MEYEEKKAIIKKIGLNAASLVLFVVVMLVGILVIKDYQVQNANETGNLILDSCVSDEENNIAIFKTLLTAGTRYIDLLENMGTDTEAMWMDVRDYLNQYYDLFTKNSTEIYGVIGGQVIYDSYITDDDYATEKWYCEAVKADGEIVYVDKENENISDRNVLTVAMKCQDSDNVLAIDVYYDNIKTISENGGLPEKSSYLVCDEDGKLIYYISDMDKEALEYQEFVDSLWDKLDTETYGKTVTNQFGEKRILFRRAMSNGWSAFLVVYRETIFEGINIVYLIIGIVAMIAIIVNVILVIWDYRNFKKQLQLQEESKKIANITNIYQKSMNSTLHEYREIYYIDLKNNRYRKLYPTLNSENETGEYDETIADKLNMFSIHNDDKNDVKKFLSLENIATELENKQYIEMKYRRKNDLDDYEWFMIGMTVSEREEGKPINVIMTIRNVKEMIHLREKTEEPLGRNFLIRLLRDIRTPLNAILGMINIAKVNIDDKKKVEYSLNIMSSSGEQLMALMDNLTDLSLVEEKSYVSDVKSDLSDMINRLLWLFKNEIKRKNINISYINDELIHRKVSGDIHHLEQILINILGNSVKFMSKDGIMHISIHEQETNVHEKVCFKIVIKTNCDCDFTVSNNEEDDPETTINVDIERNTGEYYSSIFTVSAILRTLDISDDENVETPETPYIAEEMPLDIYMKNDYSGKRILLAEDNEINTEIVGQILTAVGIQMDSVADGQLALEAVVNSNEYYYDLIFMDIQMPNMDGYEATKHIRRLKRNDARNIPIIAMSADAFAEDVKKAKDSGMNGHISKPIDISKLNTILEQWL